MPLFRPLPGAPWDKLQCVRARTPTNAHLS